MRSSYLTVERESDGTWTRTATDGDWSTRLEWHYNEEQWTTTLTWHIPRETPAGTYRMKYLDQTLGEFTVTSST